MVFFKKIMQENETRPMSSLREADFEDCLGMRKKSRIIPRSQAGTDTKQRNRFGKS